MRTQFVTRNTIKQYQHLTVPEFITRIISIEWFVCRGYDMKLLSTDGTDINRNQAIFPVIHIQSLICNQLLRKFSYWANHCGLMTPHGVIELGSLVQVIGCRLATPNRNQCWLIVSEILWHSPLGNFTGNVYDIYPTCEFENYQFNTAGILPEPISPCRVIRNKCHLMRNH